MARKAILGKELEGSKVTGRGEAPEKVPVPVSGKQVPCRLW